MPFIIFKLKYWKNCFHMIYSCEWNSAYYIIAIILNVLVTIILNFFLRSLVCIFWNRRGIIFEAVLYIFSKTVETLKSLYYIALLSVFIYVVMNAPILIKQLRLGVPINLHCTFSIILLYCWLLALFAKSL